MKAKQLKWFQNQIKREKWCLGKAIDPIWAVALGNNVSQYKARQLIQELIDDGVIEMYNNRFYLMDTDLKNDIDSVQRRLLHKAKVNTQRVSLLHEGAIFDKKTMAYILSKDKSIEVYFPLRKQKAIINLLDTGALSKELSDILKRHKFK